MRNPDSDRLRAHLAALTLVASAALVRFMVGAADPTSILLLANAAVALSAWIGGWSAGSVAVFAALLVARLSSPLPATATVLYALEGFAIAALVSKLAAALEERNCRLAAVDARIRDLQSIVRRLRAIDQAAGRFEDVAAEHALILLDRRGRIAEWRGGAARMFGWQADEAIGQRGSMLFAGATGDAAFTRLLGNASDGATGRHSGRQRRSDGTEFEADLELHELGEHARDGFALIVRDRTREQEWETFAASAADAQTALREETDVAHQQLATLQHVTDPWVNTLPTDHAITLLLDRLRDAVGADGVALVRPGPARRQILAASEGLQPETRSDRRPVDLRPLLEDRIKLVHNDPARVGAASLVAWPDTMSSLIAVPVLSCGRVEGCIEVVGVRARRSTEWEIALIQVVAARIAGRTHDALDTALNQADAVA